VTLTDFAFVGMTLLVMLMLVLFIFSEPARCPRCGRKLKVIPYGKGHAYACPKCNQLVSGGVLS